MKKFVCVLLSLLICAVILSLLVVLFNSCAEKTEKIESPLKLINEVKDQYNNILQQTFYDENSGDYLLKEYNYKLQDNKWVCVNQRTSVISNKETPSQDTNSYVAINDTLRIYHNFEFSNGVVTILDNELVTISLVNYHDAASWYEFAYELRITNKSNKVITATIDDASIMGVMCPPMFSIDHIDAGHTAYFLIGWDRDTLTRCHIPYIDNVEFMVRIFDNGNWQVPAIDGTRVLIKK